MPAGHGLEKVGHHGAVSARGFPRGQLPSWDDIQILTAQLNRLPLLGDEPVGSEIVIGPKAQKPLYLDIPLFVSDMSFGALSVEAKTALARVLTSQTHNYVHQRPVDLSASEVVAEAIDITYYGQSLRSLDTRQPRLVRNAG